MQPQHTGSGWRVEPGCPALCGQAQYVVTSAAFHAAARIPWPVSVWRLTSLLNPRLSFYGSSCLASQSPSRFPRPQSELYYTPSINLGRSRNLIPPTSHRTFRAVDAALFIRTKHHARRGCQQGARFARFRPKAHFRTCEKHHHIVATTTLHLPISRLRRAASIIQIRSRRDARKDT